MGCFPFVPGKERALKEKIKKWEEEIEKTVEKQKEMNLKSNERIRELRKKIQEAEQAMLLENNQMIAQAVREVYGEVDEETLEIFKRQMQAAKAGLEKEQADDDGGSRYPENRL